MSDTLLSLEKRVAILEEHVLPKTKEPLICPKCGAHQFIESNTYHVTTVGTIRHKDKLCHNCQYQIISEE